MSTNTQKMFAFLATNPRSTARKAAAGFPTMTLAAVRSTINTLLASGQIVARDGRAGKEYSTAATNYDVSAVRQFYNLNNAAQRARAKARKVKAKARASAKGAVKSVATPQQLANLAKARAARAANMAARQTISRTVRTAGAVDGLEHAFRLREDLTITLNLPKDLTAAEAARIGQYVATLPLNG